MSSKVNDGFLYYSVKTRLDSKRDIVLALSGPSMLHASWSQVSVVANMQAVAEAGALVLAALLRTASRAQLESCSTATRGLLHCFLYPYELAAYLYTTSRSPSLVTSFWQRVQERPSALAAAVDALQV